MIFPEIMCKNIDGGRAGIASSIPQQPSDSVLKGCAGEVSHSLGSRALSGASFPGAVGWLVCTDSLVLALAPTAGIWAGFWTELVQGWGFMVRTCLALPVLSGQNK